MLRVKLAVIDAETERRNAIANTYNAHITNPLVTTPNIFSDMLQVWHQYVVRVERRDEFRTYLANNGVETGIHYATPTALLPGIAWMPPACSRTNGKRGGEPAHCTPHFGGRCSGNSQHYQ